MTWPKKDNDKAKYEDKENLESKYKDKENKNDKDKYIESTFKERSLWLVTFDTLIIFLTIENLISWQSVLPDN